jgi:hypothetical protein
LERHLISDVEETFAAKRSELIKILARVKGEIKRGTRDYLYEEGDFDE